MHAPIDVVVLQDSGRPREWGHNIHDRYISERIREAQSREQGVLARFQWY